MFLGATTLLLIQAIRDFRNVVIFQVNGVKRLWTKTRLFLESTRFIAHILIIFALLAVTPRGVAYLEAHSVDIVKFRSTIIFVLAVKFSVYSVVDLVFGRIALRYLERKSR